MTRDEQRPLLGNEQQSAFDVSVEELTRLVDPKNPELLKQLGGVEKLCRKLRVDPSTGLSTDEGAQSSSDKAFADRQAVFGKNVLPEAKSKSFWELLWAAYNDKTLSKCFLYFFIPSIK